MSDEEMSENGGKHEEDAEKVSTEEHKEGEDDSENTQSDHVDARESENEDVSSSDRKQLDEDKEESGHESEEADGMDSEPAASDKPNKKTSTSSSADAEVSDDELLVHN